MKTPLAHALNRSRPADGLGPAQVATTRLAASLLLGYPDQDLRERLDAVRAGVAGLPEPVRAPLLGLVEHLESADPTRLAADYVDTFDLRKRSCLYLTYYTYGDTRKRGMALLRFTHAYRAAGVELAGDDGPGGGTELPDHLAVVLEFAATGDPEQGERLLREHRGAVELLRRSLHESGSPYAGALEAVSATLPPLADRDVEFVRRLALEGPPQEDVGLEPYGPPGIGDAAMEQTGTSRLGARA